MLSPGVPLWLAGDRVRPDGADGMMVSMLSARAAEAADTLPATSVSVAVRLLVPADRVLVVTDQLPFAPTVAEPTCVAPSNRAIVSPTTPVPVITGLVTLVMLSPGVPLWLAGDRVRPDGADGMMVSMLSARAAEAADTLPATSVSVAVRLLVPADRVLVVTDQLPFAPTVAEPTCVAPSNRVIVSPTTPVPVITGLVTLVMLSPGVPLSLPGARVRPDGADGMMVSMVSARAAEAADTLPATSVSVAVRLLVPADRVLVVTDQLPFAPTVAEPTCVAPSNRAIVSPTTPVPVITGLVTLVMLSPGVPLSLAGDRVRPDGADGMMVSMVSARAVEAADTLPATSVWVAVRLLVPADRVLVVTDQLPFAPTVAEPTCVAPSNRVIVSPTTPVPVITGLVTLVMLSPGVPLSLAGDRVRPDGADGMMVSMVSARAAEAADTLPATSVSVAVRLLVPADRVLVVTDQLPFAPTVAEPTCVAPSNRVIVSPTTPVPVITGLVTLVMLSPGVPLSLPGDRVRPDGADGMMVSMLGARAAEAADTLPATSVWVAVRLLVPADRVLVVTDQLPFAPTVAAPTCVAPSNRAIVSPTTPVPVIAGVVRLVMLSPGVPLSLPGARVRPDGADGMMVSMMSARAAEAADTLPATSVWVAVRLLVPGGGG